MDYRAECQTLDVSSNRNMKGFGLALDIVKGIHFLHTHNVIHRFACPNSNSAQPLCLCACSFHIPHKPEGICGHDVIPFLSFLQ